MRRHRQLNAVTVTRCAAHRSPAEIIGQAVCRELRSEAMNLWAKIARA